MSNTFATGQIFSGGTVSLAQTGQFAFTQTGSIDFTGTTPPAIQDIVITQDVLGSSQTFSGISLQALTITGVHPGTVVTLTTNDLPPGFTLPVGFTLPQNVIGTVLDFAATTNSPFVNGTGSIAVLGSFGTLELVGHAHLVANVFGSPQTIDTGAAVLSFGTQTTGAVNEVFTPEFTPACFASGTRIRTTTGNVAVENLREGDLVESTFGGTAPIVWIGHRYTDCSRHPRPQDVWPVRVLAGAFGPGLPQADLLLSPDHAVYRGGTLIPIRYLLNGASIAQQEVDRVTYWHVELPAHDVVFAEGLECESYLDTGNRAAFANAGSVVRAHADFARGVWEAESCAPLAVAGPVVEAVRIALLQRAEALGHARTAVPDIRIEVAGLTLAPERHGDQMAWTLPPGTTRAMLVSRSSVPSWTDPSNSDHRRLGVAVADITLNGAPLRASARGAGWHPAEAAWQWTDGRAEFAAGPGRLKISVALSPEYWNDEHRNDGAAQTRAA